MPQSRSIAETASFLRFAFFKSDMLFFIARTVLKRRPFSRVVQEIRGKILQSAPRFTSSHHDMIESSMPGKFWLFFKDKIM